MRQCVTVPKITSEYPLLLEIQPQTGAVMGGETRLLLAHTEAATFIVSPAINSQLLSPLKQIGGITYFLVEQ
jgi:hypothetical protein